MKALDGTKFADTPRVDDECVAWDSAVVEPEEIALTDEPARLLFMLIRQGQGRLQRRRRRNVRHSFDYRPRLELSTAAGNYRTRR
jgi:hypothetical protein